MPELPEVETVAADLRPHLVGRTITGCELRCPAVVRHPDPLLFEQGLPGRRIEALTRRGKYLLHHLDSPVGGCPAPLLDSPVGGCPAPPLDAPVGGCPAPLLDSPVGGCPPPLLDAPAAGSRPLLVVHLGMTGQWRCVAAETPEPDHLHVVLDLDDGRELRYRDPRRFGRLLLGTERELVASRALPRLGPEPIDPSFTAADLYRRLHTRRAPLKALLLDQMVVAGVGNIYADEALFRARVRPDRPGATLSRRAVGRLREALDASLRQAIGNRGSSVDDYRDAWGEMGRQQAELQVYGRAGLPCVHCGRPLATARLGGRTTVFCRHCQR